MAIALVNTTGVVSLTGTADVVPLGFTPTVGNVLIIMTSSAFGTPFTPTQTGITYTRDVYAAPLTTRLGIWRGVVTGAVGASVTIPRSGASAGLTEIREYSGLDTADLIDQTKLGSFSSSSTTMATNPFDTDRVSNNELYLAIINIGLTGAAPFSDSGSTPWALDSTGVSQTNLSTVFAASLTNTKSVSDVLTVIRSVGGSAHWGFVKIAYKPFITPPTKATNPDPINGAATNIPFTQDLFWDVDALTTESDVYVGSSFAAVSAATTSDPEYKGRITTAGPGTFSYDPGDFSPGETVYWRIDTVNAPKVTAGDVWSFTVEVAPDQATTPSPADTATEVDHVATTLLDWADALNADTYDVYWGNDEAAVTAATTSDPEFQGNVAVSQIAAMALNYGEQWYWRVDSVGDGGKTKGATWSFSTETVVPPASPVGPLDAVSGVSVATLLEWNAGQFLDTYNVYLNTSPTFTVFNKVAELGSGVTQYDPGGLDYLRTYYWKIEAVNGLGAESSPVWSFTTEEPPRITATNIIHTQGSGSAGGDLIEVTGELSGEGGNEYDCFIGPNGDHTDPPGLSGRPGKPNTVIASDVSLRCYLPELDPGIYSVTFLRTADRGRIIGVKNNIIVMPQQYRNAVFSMRSMLPTSYKTGARASSGLTPPAPPPAIGPQAPVITSSPVQDDNTVSGTCIHDLADIVIYADGEEIGSSTVQNQVWTVQTNVLNTGESITAKVVTDGGENTSTPVVVS